MPCFVQASPMLLEDVPIEQGKIHAVVVGDLRVPHTEAVVMLGGDYNVLHSGVLNGLHPCVRIKLHRVELFRVFLVLRNRNICLFHDPFANSFDRLAFVNTGWDGVDPQCMNRPNRASRHHSIRASRTSGFS